ncbi:type II secretion system F family protein [Cellulomonas sp. Marseille-Q8402]
MGEVLLPLLVAGSLLLLRPIARRPSSDGGPSRAAVRTGSPDADGTGPSDVVTVVELIAVAVESGASVPGALDAVGTVLGGRTGSQLTRAGAALLLGAPWETAWAHAPALGGTLDGLAAAWRTGAAPGPPLRTVVAELRRRRDRAGREAAARLGVRLVLPLGLCFLPAFVLVGLVPVLVSLGRSLLG